MSAIGNLFARLFARTPAAHESGYGPVYAAVVARLERTGVGVGRTAGYPRIEVHTINEGERMDKEGAVRQVTLTVESISNHSIGQAAAMNEENVVRLTSELALPQGWRCFGVVPDQLQDLTESSDSAKIIYRLLQGFTVWVERLKEDEEEPGDTEIAVPEDPEGPVDIEIGPVEPDPDPAEEQQPIEPEPVTDEPLPDEPLPAQEEE